MVAQLKVIVQLCAPESAWKEHRYRPNVLPLNPKGSSIPLYSAFRDSFQTNSYKDNPKITKQHDGFILSSSIWKKHQIRSNGRRSCEFRPSVNRKISKNESSRNRELTNIRQTINS